MPDDKKQEELLRLTKENNRMLHAMRRNAFIGGVIKFLLYITLFVLAPLWLYATYLAPLVQSMNQAINQMQGTGAKVQADFSSFQNAWKQFEAKFPSFGQAKQ